jgi:hypothetical protein
MGHMLLIMLLKMSLVLKILPVLVVSSIKFAFAPPYAIQQGFNYYESIILTTAGGIGGVLFFFYLSTAVLKAYDWLLHKIKHTTSKSYRRRARSHNKPRKVFSRKTRFLIKLRGKYGMIGIAFLTPILLSIPIGSFIANKYYKNKGVLWYLFLSVAFWSGLLSAIYFL